jgi:hypothetical protein
VMRTGMRQHNVCTSTREVLEGGWVPYSNTTISWVANSSHPFSQLRLWWAPHSCHLEAYRPEVLRDAFRGVLMVSCVRWVSHGACDPTSCDASG